MKLSSAFFGGANFLLAIGAASAVDLERRAQQHDLRALRDGADEGSPEEDLEAVSVELSMGMAFSKGVSVR